MERIKNFLFSILNFLIIGAVIALIGFGLAKIGLLEPPAFLSALFDTSQSGEKDNYGFADELPENSGVSDNYTVIKAELTPESVIEILKNVKPAEEYSHDLQYMIYSGNGSVSKRVVVSEKDGVSCAYFLTDGIATKQIVRNTDTTTVNTISSGKMYSSSYKTGNFDFESEIGAIITHKDFLAAAENPDGYTFSLASGNNGTVLLLKFSTVIDSYVQTQNYTLNLDYGIVTEANCYENGKLVYSMATNALSKNHVSGINIPESFSEFLNTGSSDNNSSEQ